MERLLSVVATIAIVSTVLPALGARIVLRKTNLIAAANWSLVTIAAWTAASLASLVPLATGWRDQLWLLAAVLTASPFIAVLGARRPGARVWSVFIVAPLTLVLALPAATAWNHDLSIAPLHLEAPMIAGDLLVLVMGTGNYLGTRFSLPALMGAAAGLLAVESVSTSFSARREALRLAATALAGAAVWIAGRIAACRQPDSIPPLDRVWRDFRDFFGIVWGRRIMDRVNAAAAQGNWAVRLHPEGFRPLEAGADPLRPAQVAKGEESLRWHLRRFVDSEWIDERMN